MDEKSTNDRLVVGGREIVESDARKAIADITLIVDTNLLGANYNKWCLFIVIYTLISGTYVSPITLNSYQRYF